MKASNALANSDFSYFEIVQCSAMGPLVRQSSDVFVFAGEAWLPVWHAWPWWCLVKLSLSGKYGLVRAQYYRICLGVLVLYSAWILYLLVLTRITKIDFCITSLDLLLVQFSQIGLWFCFTETIPINLVILQGMCCMENVHISLPHFKTFIEQLHKLIFFSSLRPMVKSYTLLFW